MKKLLFLLVLSFYFLANVKAVHASQGASASSAVLATATAVKPKRDDRVTILRRYLEKHNSPLAPYASTFIQDADKYNLDWRLVAAISGLESTFGKEIPYDSYNGWGWGIYGTNRYYFKSWKDGINTVSKGLRKNYMDKWGAQNIYQIGAMYAASPTWAERVSYYMRDIQNFSLRNPSDMLSISI